METDMTSNIPPKQTVGETLGAPNAMFGEPYARMPEQPGALVSIHNAALHANPDSFPVLKAFQDYLEAERQRARQRLILLSAFFAVLLIVVMGGLVAIGVYLFGNMSATQSQLLSALLEYRTHPPASALQMPDSSRQPPAGEQASLALSAAAKPEPPPLPDFASLDRLIEERVAARLATAAAKPDVTSPSTVELDAIKTTLAALQQENEALRATPRFPPSIGPLVPRSAVPHLNPPPTVADQAPVPAVAVPASAPPPPALATVPASRPGTPPTTPLQALKATVVATPTASSLRPLDPPSATDAMAYRAPGNRLTVAIPGKQADTPIPWRIVLPAR